MSLRTLLLGQRLATDEEHRERFGPLAAIPALGLDALSSAAYGPEAALAVLRPLGAPGSRHLVPLSAAIIALLVVVCVSYRQTIEAYPSGGGSYTVAKENGGPAAGLVAAAALMIDYILNVAVAISAGVGALVSAVSSLHPHTLPLCLAVLGILVLANLRGPRSAGIAFSLPTYTFVGCLFTVIAIGAWQTVVHHGHPLPRVAPPAPPSALGAAGAWILVRAFANGCTAMTGVEAVSNGVPAFRAPSSVLARRTLSIIVALLVALLAGVAVLSRAYGVTAMDPSRVGYESVLSQITAAVAGRGVFYDVTMAAIVSVLMLSANTSFADFPRLCRILAGDGFLPAPFEHRGRRLAFSYGIVALATLAGALLVVFRGVTEGLIPLFAIGAFLAFTMSQAGMVLHWRRERGKGSRRALFVNALGAVATASVLLVEVVSKLAEGAWISLLLVAVLLAAFAGVRHHRRAIEARTHTRAPLSLDEREPIVVVPLRGWDRVSRSALRFAYCLSDDVYALQVRTGDIPVDDLTSAWRHLAEAPAERAGRRPPRLVVFESRYRQLYRPILGFITHVAGAHPDRRVAVIVPAVVMPHWYHRLLHDNTALLLRWMLELHGSDRIAVVSVPWYLDERARP